MNSVQNFQTTKINEDENWRIIHQICVLDKEKGEHDFVSNLNYCINEPYFEKTLSLRDEVEKKLTVLLYQISGDVTIFSKHDKGEKIFLGKN